MVFIALLIPLCAWIWASIFCSTGSSKPMSWLFAAMLLSLFVVLTTEALSVFHGIGFLSLTLSWSLLLLSGLLVLSKRKSRVILPEKKHLPVGGEWYLVLPIAIILLSTLVLALVAFPNNWDSMTYHLTRVQYWREHGSIVHYATNNVRQITQAPLAEYWSLHWMVLSGADRAANLVQWSAFFGSMLAVWCLMEEWRMTRIQRLMGILLLATIPMAILQSTSTQNDLVASFFLLVTVLFGYRAIQHKKASSILALCLSAALAVCTKGTIYIFLIPWSLFFIVRLFGTYRWRIWQPAILLIVTMMLVNGPHWIRNMDTFGSPLAADETLKNDQFGVAPTVTNLLKNIAMECKTPIPMVNDYLTKGVVLAHNMLGLDINDARWNWRYSSSFEVGRFSMHEDQAGNSWHVLLFLLAVPIVWWKGSKGMKWYALCVVAMWLVFSGLLKWQEWHNRLHLPMFFLMVPVMVHAISTWKRMWQYVVLAIFFTLSIPYLFLNQSRPQAGPDNVWKHYSYHQYFINKPERLQTFLQMAAVVERNQVHSLGWATSGDAWEYPMWVILEDNLPEMRHVFVQNDSRVFERRSWHPEGIISNRNEIAQLPSCVYNGVAYYRTYTNGEWSFFLPVRHP